MLKNLYISYNLYEIYFLLFQTDKTRVVDENTGRVWANNCGFYYFETSAQTGDGVNKMFQVLYEMNLNKLYIWSFIWHLIRSSCLRKTKLEVSLLFLNNYIY